MILKVEFQEKIDEYVNRLIVGDYVRIDDKILLIKDKENVYKYSLDYIRNLKIVML